MSGRLSRRGFLQGITQRKTLDVTKAAEPRNEDRARVFERDISSETFELNGAKVTMIGVNHVPGTFDAVPGYWKEQIESADIVLLEGAPLAEKTDRDGAVAQITKELQDAGWKQFQIESAIKNATAGYEFFKRLDMLAHDVDTPIAVADPRKGDLKLDEALKSFDDDVHSTKIALAAGGVGLGAMIFMLTGIQKILGRGPDRREALKLIGGAAVSAAGVASEVSALYERRTDVVNADRREGKHPLEQLIFHLEDYRDVCDGKALEILSRTYKNITVVRGRKHMKATREYAERPREASVKLAAYRATYGWIESPSLRLYTPVPADADGRPRYNKEESAL